jgi:hypothetical protein
MTDWRDILPVHPATELLPSISPEELKALADDIKASGLQFNILASEIDGKLQLIDGRNRLDAMQQLGYRFEVLGGDFCFTSPSGREGKADLIGDGADPYALALSLNVHRRHLTSEQKRAIIVRLLEAQPELSNRAIAAEVKVSPNTVRAVRSKSTDQFDQLAKTVGRDGRRRTTAPKKPKQQTVAALERKVRELVAAQPDLGVREIATKLQVASDFVQGVISASPARSLPAPPDWVAPRAPVQSDGVQVEADGVVARAQWLSDFHALWARGKPEWRRKATELVLGQELDDPCVTDRLEP